MVQLGRHVLLCALFVSWVPSYTLADGNTDLQMNGFRNTVFSKFSQVTNSDGSSRKDNPSSINFIMYRQTIPIEAGEFTPLISGLLPFGNNPFIPNGIPLGRNFPPTEEYYDTKLKRLSEDHKNITFETNNNYVKSLRINITYNKDISLKTEKRKISMFNFPSNNKPVKADDGREIINNDDMTHNIEWLRRYSRNTISSIQNKESTSTTYSVYGFLRVSGEGEPDGDACPIVTEPMQSDEEVRCTFGSDETVVCERALGVTTERSDVFKSVLVLTTEYRSREELRDRSLCVREVQNTLRVLPGNRIQTHLQVKNLTNSTIGSSLAQVIQPFQEMVIEATMDFKTRARIIDIGNGCLENRTSADCQITLRRDASASTRREDEEGDLRHNEAVQKSALLLQMALGPLFEPDVDLFSNKNEQELKISSSKSRKFPDMLLHWNSMKKLDLSRNGLSVISKDYFKQVPYLEVLNLAENEFTTVPEEIHELKKLRDLDLSRNPIVNMDQLSRVLEGLSNLQLLDLSEVPVRTLDPLQPALSTINLRTLKLRQCQLTSISSKITRDIFRQQSSLVTINLSENSIKSLPKDLFVDMHELKLLDLSSTGLEYGPTLTLGSSKLYILDLSRNNLTNIDNLVTFSSGGVYYLYLQQNMIEEWEDAYIFRSRLPINSEINNYVSDTPWVQSLNLANNRIKTVSKTMGMSLQALVNVELGDNPIDCGDCRTKEFQCWLSSIRNRYMILINGINKQIECVTPEIVRHQPVLRMNYVNEDCQRRFSYYYWLLLIPVGLVVLILIVMKILLYVNRAEVSYFKHLVETKLNNRKKAVALLEKHFEYDVYLIHSVEDWKFARHVQCRLENGPEKYKVHAPDPSLKASDKEYSNIDNNVINSRHVLVLLSNSMPKTDFSRRGVERTNFRNLTGDYHNLIFVAMAGLNKESLPLTIQYLTTTHDYIDWPPCNKSEAKAWKKVISYLGTSNHQVWQGQMNQSDV